MSFNKIFLGLNIYENIQNLVIFVSNFYADITSKILAKILALIY